MRKCGGLEDSEGNGKERKRAEKSFGEKRCKMGGVSLQRAYRKLIRILEDWYRKGV